MSREGWKKISMLVTLFYFFCPLPDSPPDQNQMEEIHITNAQSSMGRKQMEEKTEWIWRRYCSYLKQKMIYSVSHVLLK